ncbi:MAG: carbohydrate kinase family protein [Actinobacteria bacterium]|nr:carbohydrate kinase family protein [Actinomycetota bacterium]
MNGTIYCIGDAMVDVIVELGEEINQGSDTQSKISMVGGGAAANTSCWIAHQGLPVRFIGKVGSDAAGRQFISELERFGVQHGELTVKGATSGMVVVLVDQRGERTMFPDPGANSLLSAGDLPALDGVSGVFISGYSLYKEQSEDAILKIIEKVRSANIPLIFDPASVGPMRNFGREKVLAILNTVDCLILNRDEARFLADNDDVAFAARFLHQRVATVIIKLGGDGAIGIDTQEEIIQSPSVATKVLDTTGAGDAFAAGFLPLWLNDRQLKPALDSGNLLASKCVAILGARPRVIAG